MIAFYLMLQVAAALPASTDMQRLAYSDYEKCITVQAAMLEPSDVGLDDLFVAAKGRCSRESDVLSKAVDEYTLEGLAGTEAPVITSARSFLYLEQRAVDAAKPIIVGMRAQRKGR